MTRLKAMKIGAMAAGATFAVTVITVWALMQGQAPGRAAGAAGGGAAGGPTGADGGQESAPVVMPAGDRNLRETNDVRVYRMVKDAVVNITSSRTVTVRASSGNDLFDHMMPQALPLQQVQAQSLGSGFVIHPSGYIITNEHVVEEGTDVECVFSDGEKLPAEVIATDNQHDLAVLKVAAKKPLHAVALGSSEDLMIGEPVYAIGNPFGYAGTMTRGIVSAVNRTLDMSPEKSYKGLIQTDASINPGNSGGPLLNAYGQVIGINTAIRAGAEGIGFAIAVSNMRDLLPEFLNPEVLNRAQVGFTVEEKRQMRPPSDVVTSVLIKKVQAGTEAAKAGLRDGDEITSISGMTVNNVVDALVAMAGARPGDTLRMDILRGEKKMDLRVAVTKAPVPPAEGVLLSKMGIKGQTVTQSLASRQHLVVTQGVYVDSVETGSAADKCGLHEGDVVIQLGWYRITSVEDLAYLLKKVDEPVNAAVHIIRGNTRGMGTILLK